MQKHKLEIVQEQRYVWEIFLNRVQKCLKRCIYLHSLIETVKMSEFLQNIGEFYERIQDILQCSWSQVC